MDDKLTSALIAAGVSLIVALSSYLHNRRSLQIQRKQFEKQMQRQFTQKLYDLRLEYYPKLYLITSKLSGRVVRANSEVLTPDYVSGVVNELNQWRIQYGLILSENAEYNFIKLRKALRRKPESKGMYSAQQCAEIWSSRVDLNRAIRTDLGILYKEDVNDQSE
jgi:hypothetical protein